MAQRFLVIRAASRLTVREGDSGGRRKLCEIFDQGASPIAEEALRRIAELRRIEVAIAGVTSETRRAVRQARAKPLVDDFAGWLARARSRVSAR